MNNLLEDDVNLDVELEQADNRYWVEQKVALDSLMNKPFFKDLIEEGYFKDYAFELVMQLTDRAVVAEGRRSAVLEKLVGVAKLKDYFDMVGALANTEDTYNEEVAKYELDEKNRLTKLAMALEQAEKDKDFKLLVVKNYCVNHAASQTSLITNDGVVRSGHRTDVLETLAGISTLRNYLINIRKELAVYAVPDDDEDSEE